jgi:hypothetical protein
MATHNLTIKNGGIVPTPEAAKQMVDSLRKSIKKNPDLGQRFQKNPRKILADRGYTRELQNEFLIELGKNVTTSLDSCACTGCCATSSLCCGTV